jgi:hypothetical protein
LYLRRIASNTNIPTIVVFVLFTIKKNYRGRVTFSDMKLILIFTKIHELVMHF